MKVNFKIDVVEFVEGKQVHELVNIAPQKNRAGVRYYQPKLGEIKNVRVLSVDHMSMELDVDQNEILGVAINEKLEGQYDRIEFCW